MGTWYVLSSFRAHARTTADAESSLILWLSAMCARPLTEAGMPKIGKQREASQSTF
jgi:hypothetical protein